MEIVADVRNFHDHLRSLDHLYRGLFDAALISSHWENEMIDGGAPQISLAAAEFESAAIQWQEQAKIAAERAMHYTQLAAALHEAYRHAIAEAIRMASHSQS